jgi:hypothetical protein
MIWASVKRLFFIRISSFILPRKFYLPNPLFAGGITVEAIPAQYVSMQRDNEANQRVEQFGLSQKRNG